VSDSAAAGTQDRSGEAATLPVPPYEPVRVVPTRPDGWPDWLGRRPVSSADRDKILKDLRADQDELNTVERRDGIIETGYRRVVVLRVDDLMRIAGRAPGNSPGGGRIIARFPVNAGNRLSTAAGR
jgi:hypothetical protein